MIIMANLTEAEPFIDSAERQKSDSPRLGHADSLLRSADSASPWNYTTVSALLLLVVVWAFKLYTTWGAWGSVTVDSGHEMYVPLLLAEGKQLYRDVWFMYGPAAPYFTSYLYRIFGAHLNVLYWAGSLSALGSAIFLYLAGMRLSSWVFGWTAGVVVLMEAFEPSLFCFPLPYASAAVYACFIGCLFVWLVVSASFSGRLIWIFLAGTAAALALLLKPEFGIACYGTLALLTAARALKSRSWQLFAMDTAAILPGVVVCGLVVRWMVSIAGVEFITQENIVSWPTAYFMKTYGRMWLEKTGFTVSGSAFEGAFYRFVPVLAVMAASYIFLSWKKYDTRALLTRALIFFLLALYFIKHNYFILAMKQDILDLFRTIFFPQDMVLYVIVAATAAWCYLLWRPASARSLAFSLLLAFSGLLAFRVLMRMHSFDYPIYYNGPVVLSYLLILSMIIPRSKLSRRSVFSVELILCLFCLTPVYLSTGTVEAGANDYVPLTTDRGVVGVPPHMAENYAAAIRFMKEKASLGQSVLSIPEDTSLYFLSGTHCPIRMFSFTPGVLAPGKMTRDTIQEIDDKRVDYLLWSNRAFPEFGVPNFGEDFDREVGEYLKSHYRPIGPLLPDRDNGKKWTAVIWERKSESESR
jgi:hypothetical protein